MVVRKNQALVSTWESLSYAQRELESLHLQTASMTQQVADCMSATLKPVLHLFENALQQVDHFHRPLVVSRGKFGQIKCLKMETLFLCRSDPGGHFVFFLCTSCRVPCNGHTCMQILSSLEWNVFFYMCKVYSCDPECKALDVYLYDHECKASDSMWNYWVFPRSLLDVPGSFSGQGSVPFPPTRSKPDQG